MTVNVPTTVGVVLSCHLFMASIHLCVCVHIILYSLIPSIYSSDHHYNQDSAVMLLQKNCLLLPLWISTHHLVPHPCHLATMNLFSISTVILKIWYKWNFTAFSFIWLVLFSVNILSLRCIQVVSCSSSAVPSFLLLSSIPMCGCRACSTIHPLKGI